MVQIAIYLSVIVFNERFSPILQVMKEIRPQAQIYAAHLDEDRISIRSVMRQEGHEFNIGRRTRGFFMIKKDNSTALVLQSIWYVFAIMFCTIIYHLTRLLFQLCCMTSTRNIYRIQLIYFLIIKKTSRYVSAAQFFLSLNFRNFTTNKSSKNTVKI